MLTYAQRNLLILVGAFLISLAIRVPQVGRPLSKHHEFATGTALIAMKAWQKGGIANYYHAPSVTFPGDANKHIGTLTYDFMQRDGIHYYLSHTPFAFYLPYGVFSLLGIEVDVAPLQWFNVLFHLVTSLLLLSVMRLVVDRPNSPVPLAASLFYLFTPATLWYHGNVYMSDMFVQNVWMVNLLVTLHLIIHQKFRSPLYHFLFAVTLALTIYTEWLGIFVAIATGGLALFRIFRQGDVRYAPLLILSGMIPPMVIVGVLYQYAQIAGGDTLIKYYTMRYAERGSVGFDGIGGVFHHLILLGKNYLTSFLPLLLLVVVAWIIQRTRGGMKVNINPKMGLFLWFTITPVVLDHLVFLKYAHQEFAVLKAGFMLCAVAAYIAVRVWSHPVVFPLTLVCAAGIAMYYFINRPGEVSWRGVPYATEMHTGKRIASIARPTQTIFCSGFKVTTSVSWYAQRNIEEVKNVHAAERWLQDHGRKEGILFYFEEDDLLHRTVRSPEQVTFGP